MQRRIKPSKIICVGLNYKQHAAEMKMALPAEPIIFLKPPTAIIYDGDTIICPSQSKNVHYEAELGIVMGKENQIAGYVCANDVTARDLQAKDGQWTRAKSFNTFCPVGTNIVSDIDPSDLRIRTILNGQTVQDSRTGDMIFSVPQIVAFVSSIMMLHPDDLILTGTPQGVGQIKPGDTVVVEIQGIGKLTNSVR
jgi:2-keto-4-pentenoate hydratase/2-oxohepta-3-ene-1,7-dioic acid hydratase in catechol pathway